MTVDENKSSPLLTCSICHKISKDTKFYLEHIIIHFERNFPCDQCDQIFDKGRLTFKTSMNQYIFFSGFSLKHHEIRKHDHAVRFG